MAPAAAPGAVLPFRFCALIYQTLWLRLLALVFGVTVYAASTVLASFMSGLAIGSLLAGFVAERTKHPLRLFGIAELFVGITALLTPWALMPSTRLYLAWYPSLAGNLGQLTLVRFLLSFAVLLVPTVLMGSTLPLVLNPRWLATVTSASGLACSTASTRQAPSPARCSPDSCSSRASGCRPRSRWPRPSTP